MEVTAVHKPPAGPDAPFARCQSLGRRQVQNTPCSRHAPRGRLQSAWQEAGCARPDAPRRRQGRYWRRHTPPQCRTTVATTARVAEEPGLHTATARVEQTATCAGRSVLVRPTAASRAPHEHAPGPRIEESLTSSVL